MIQNNILNLFFAIVGASVTLFLGALVYFHDSKSVSARIFLTHSIIGSVWAIVNYFSVSVNGEAALGWIRFVIFFAVPHVFLFFLLVLNFPEKKLSIKGTGFAAILAIMGAMMALALTPLVFQNVVIGQSGPIPIPGKLIPLFGSTLVFFFILTCILVLIKYVKADGELKRQWLFIGTGLAISYSLLILLVFLRVIIYGDSTFVPYSPLFLLPIFAGASWAIRRHNLFDVKIITTELLVFVLLMISFVQILASSNWAARFAGISALIFIMISGTLLIKSVLNEVKQREQLQVLTAQLKRANEQLKALDKARADFITIASHQLRTPPSTIKWYLAAVLAGDFGPVSRELYDPLKKTELTNNSMISLIDDMLNVSRIERGKIEFLFEKAELGELIRITVDQLAPLAKMKGLKLGYKKPKKPLEIMMDREKLRQVINNLIDNAIKYTKAGQVTVTVENDQKNITVKVVDTGIGIPPEEAHSLFTKFSRGKSAQNYSAGLGLGLYLAKVVIEQHRGKIWAESEGAGKGATFIIQLPIKSGLRSPTRIVDLVKQNRKSDAAATSQLKVK